MKPWEEPGLGPERRVALIKRQTWPMDPEEVVAAITAAAADAELWALGGEA